MATLKANSSSVQLSLFPCQGTSVNDAKNGNQQIAKLSTVSDYMKSPEALWRMLATYPKQMPVEDAIRRARIDFTRCRKEVAV